MSISDRDTEYISRQQSSTVIPENITPRDFYPTAGKGGEQLQLGIYVSAREKGTGVLRTIEPPFSKSGSGRARPAGTVSKPASPHTHKIPSHQMISALDENKLADITRREAAVNTKPPDPSFMMSRMVTYRVSDRRTKIEHVRFWAVHPGGNIEREEQDRCAISDFEQESPVEPLDDHSKHCFIVFEKVGISHGPETDPVFLFGSLDDRTQYTLFVTSLLADLYHHPHRETDRQHIYSINLYLELRGRNADKTVYPSPDDP